MGAVAAAVAAVNPDVDPRRVTLVLVAPALSGATSSNTVRRTLSTKFVQLMQALKLSSAAAFVFNWAVVPVMLPVTALLLHPLVYNGNFWKVRTNEMCMILHVYASAVGIRRECTLQHAMYTAMVCSSRVYAR
jgi:hypothetical protein